MSFSKKTREAVYAKYDGHCAYCGRDIDIKDMQVDHFLPLRAWGIYDVATDDISNLMPAGCATTTNGQIRLKRSGAISRKFQESSEKTTSTRWGSSMATSLRTRNR